MSNRSDIATGRLIYTCRCGFIDTGHANPGSATILWNNILYEHHVPDHRLNNHHTIEGKPCFLLDYFQGMGTKVIQVLHSQRYLICKGLSIAQKKRVALRIFMEVSMGFEQMQQSPPWSWGTQSGFSAEDLMSNLPGFYRAVEGHSWQSILNICHQTSQATAFEVYETHFKNGIEGHKVTEFFKPLIFPCKECTGSQSFPEALMRIKPADPHNGDFIRIVQHDLPWHHWLLNQAIDFDRWGQPRQPRANPPYTTSRSRHRF